jgi:hypothetical protein
LRAREFQTETDPMRRMWDALAENGCQPLGERHTFMARCPVHHGTNRNLRVSEGTDGRVLLFCLAHPGVCDWRAVSAAVGLDPRELFPPGHRRGMAAKPRPVKSLSAGAAFLDAMTGAGYGWQAELLGVECPYCGAPDAYLTVHDRGGLDVNCPDGCGAVEVRRAVETRAAIAEKLRVVDGRKDAA